MHEEQKPAFFLKLSIILLVVIAVSGAVWISIAGYLQIQSLGNSVSELKEKVSALSDEVSALSEKTQKLQSDLAIRKQATAAAAELSVSNTVPASTEKVVYLTFDDGPSQNTKKLLDFLDQQEIKATFFVNYKSADWAKPYYKMIVDRGHVIANHTSSHVYKNIYSSAGTYLKDTLALNNFVKEQTGVWMDLIRFPGGSLNCKKFSEINNLGGSIFQTMKENGFTYFDWNVSAEDASIPKQTAEQLKQNIYRNVFKYKHSVILMHDGARVDDLIQILPSVIKTLTENGYSFGVLSKDMPLIQHYAYQSQIQ